MKYKFKDLTCIGIFLIVVSILSLGNLHALDVIFDDHQYSFQLLRTMGYSSTGGADIAECLRTAYLIEEANNESWYMEWNDTAERLEKTAEKFLKEGTRKKCKGSIFPFIKLL